MSFDVNWDIDKYKEDFESDEQWNLRRAFMEKWKNDYPEERLICLARVFTNIEFMGCRYPTEVMLEVSRLSDEIAKSYRNSRKNKLQRTFVSASTAAEDRAKGVKRKGGVVTDSPAKSARIAFVPSSNNDLPHIENDQEETNPETKQINPETKPQNSDNDKEINKEIILEKRDINNYMEEMLNLKCLDIRNFNDDMFETEFGRMVLLIRPWASKMWNIQASCQTSKVSLNSTYERRLFSLRINGKLIAEARGDTKLEARNAVEVVAWNRLRESVVSVVVKEQWIAHGDSRISVNDVSGPSYDTVFGTAIESNVAAKMMQMMGWAGGGLGVDEQGISEPIQANLQMVNRAGLGSQMTDVRKLRRAANKLMERFMESDTLDVDLVFASDFNKDERTLLHQCANRIGLASRSYGDKDRFLVVRKKLDPFSLVQAVIEKGGNTPKYQVFIPASLQDHSQRQLIIRGVAESAFSSECNSTTLQICNTHSDIHDVSLHLRIRNESSDMSTIV